MPFADSAGARIYYDDRGVGEPTLLCLPGWCVHHTIFAPTVERLSARHRVLALDWRGHGRSPASEGDWGHPEMVADALAVIRASGAESVIPLTQAHAGWIALLLRQRLGERVPKMVFASWNPIVAADNPLAAPFLEAMQALQDEDRWGATVEQLVSLWLRDAPAAVAAQMREETSSHGFEDWARGAQEISATYGHEGDPLQALGRLRPAVSALHVYAQPRAPEYLAAQESFAGEHPWFTVRRVEAVSHFPTLEAPEESAEVIEEFIG